MAVAIRDMYFTAMSILGNVVDNRLNVESNNNCYIFSLYVLTYKQSRPHYRMLLLDHCLLGLERKRRICVQSSCNIRWANSQLPEFSKTYLKTIETTIYSKHILVENTSENHPAVEIKC